VSSGDAKEEVLKSVKAFSIKRKKGKSKDQGRIKQMKCTKAPSSLNTEVSMGLLFLQYLGSQLSDNINQD